MSRHWLIAASIFTASSSALLAGQSVTVMQRNRAFSHTAITVQRGDTVRFTNEDGFPHQIYVSAPDFAFDSDAQLPGATVSFSIPTPGRYRVLCGIHPKMRLDIEVR